MVLLVARVGALFHKTLQYPAVHFVYDVHLILNCLLPIMCTSSTEAAQKHVMRRFWCSPEYKP